MGALDVWQLTNEQIEKLCVIPEQNAKFFLTRLPLTRMTKLNISIETEIATPITLTVAGDIELSKSMNAFNLHNLV